MILRICREEAEMGKIVAVTMLGVGLIGLFVFLANIWREKRRERLGLVTNKKIHKSEIAIGLNVGANVG